MNLLIRQVFSGAAQLANGEGWTQRQSNTTNRLNSVDYGAGVWVAVGNSGTIVTTSDSSLASWSAVISGTSENLVSVVRGPDKFVAISSGAVFVSTTGRQWSNLSLPAGINAKKIRYLNGKYYAVGTGIAVSDDGLTWTSRTNPVVGQDLRDVAYGQNKFIAPAYTKLATSTDGVTWTSQNMNDTYFSAPINDFLYAPDRNEFWGVCYMGLTNFPIKFVIYSNGYSAYIGAGAPRFNRFGIAYSDGKFVMTGAGIYTSMDMMNDTTRETTNDPLYGVKYSSEVKRYVAVGETGFIFTSNR